MKKNLLFLGLIPTLLLSGCNQQTIDKSKLVLKYGNYHLSNVSLSTLQEYDYDELKAAIDNKETFVLLINREIGEHTSCGCWNDFVPVFCKFSSEYHYDFKLFNVNLLDGKNSFGIHKKGGDLPGICFFKNGKLLRQTIYVLSKGETRRMFSEYALFEEYMLRNVYLPKAYYVDRDYLDYKIENNHTFNLFFDRSKCPDCTEIKTTYINNWINSNKEITINDPLYMLDLQEWYASKPDPLPEEPSPTQEEIDEYNRKMALYEIYQGIKDQYGLSNEYNTTFGYGTGAVPTFQRRTGSTITDMITVLNDSVEKIAEGQYQLHSYFTEERIASSPILRNTGNIYKFDGMPLDPSEVEEIEYKGKIYIVLKDGRAKQMNWHKPIVDLFFEAYVK